MRGSSFFDGIRQIELTIESQIVKQPCFYFDSASMTALFAARRSALRALMPDASYVPARLAPGLGIVAVVCYENRDTDVGPYNNVGIAVVLEAPPAGRFPGRWAWRWLTSGESHVYVLHMPENSELPVLAGIELLGYPKFQALVEIGDEGDRCVCRVIEKGEHLLTMRGLRLPARKETTVRQISHVWMDGQPQSHEVRIHQHQSALTARREATVLELGPHPLARELDRLLVSRRALIYAYVPSSEMIVFGAEHLTPKLLKSALEAIERGRDN